MKLPAMVLLLVVGVLFATPAAADIVMPQSVIASGGGELGNQEYVVQSTVGQAAIGVMSDQSHIAEIGFWFQWVGVVVGIEDAEATIPLEFWLGQNYPNPFNPVTMLEFSVPERSQVTLRLYDVVGREVKTLVDREMEPGFHEAALHANGLASGIYYCRMSAGSYVNTRKLVLIK